MYNKIKITEFLSNFIEDNKQEEISIEEIINILSDRSFGLLLIFFALPNIIPIPGISTIMGMPLIFFSIQLILAFKKPWLPKFIVKKKIKFQSLSHIITKSLPYFKKLEFFLKERGNLTHGRLGESLIGFFTLIFSVTITLPIIFGNALPSIGIILMAVGLFAKDSLLVIIGIIVGCIGVSLAALVVFIGIEAFWFLTQKIY